MIAFDPSIRIFQISFTNKNELVEYGKQEIRKLFGLGKKMDKPHSRIEKHTEDFYSASQERIRYKNQRIRWRKQDARMRNRDMHRKLARDIVQGNKHISISRFLVSDMVQKD
jgi:hypothetical protein